MKKTLTFIGLSAALTLSFATSAHAWGQPSSTTSTTCPDKQTTTTTRAPSTTTSVPSTSSTSEPTSSSTTPTTAPSSTTSTTVEETTTTTVEATTTTVAPTTTTVEATTTTVLDDVELIPPIFITSGDITELPETGFPYWNVALFAIGVLALGFAGLLIREMATR